VTRATRGCVALPVGLLVLLVTSLVSAALAELARTEALMARDRRIAAAALAAADACVADVTSILPAGWDFDALVAGADGVVGTADDGAVVTPLGCSATLAAGPGGGTRPLLEVRATVAGGSRSVRALLVRPPRPLAPSVLWVVDPASLGAIGGQLALDGLDPLRPDAAALPVLAGPADASALDTRLAVAGTVTVAAGTPAPEYAPPPPLAALRARLEAAGAGSVLALAAAPPPPSLQAIGSDATVASAGFGAGVLYVDGRLDIDADFSFSGVVVAVGGVRVASGATLTIAGSLWVGGAPALDVAGRAILRHDEAALEATDALFVLPRRAAAGGCQDL
jgi:hypothetical protein